MLCVQKLLWPCGISIFMWWIHRKSLWLSQVQLCNQSPALCLKRALHGAEQSLRVQLHCCAGHCSWRKLSMNLMKDFGGLLTSCYVFLPLLGLKNFYIHRALWVARFGKILCEMLMASALYFTWGLDFHSASQKLRKDSSPLNYCTQEGDSCAFLDDS